MHFQHRKGEISSLGQFLYAKRYVIKCVVQEVIFYDDSNLKKLLVLVYCMKVVIDENCGRLRK